MAELNDVMEEEDRFIPVHVFRHTSVKEKWPCAMLWKVLFDSYQQQQKKQQPHWNQFNDPCSCVMVWLVGWSLWHFLFHYWKKNDEKEEIWFQKWGNYGCLNIVTLCLVPKSEKCPGGTWSCGIFHVIWAVVTLPVLCLGDLKLKIWNKNDCEHSKQDPNT